MKKAELLKRYIFFLIGLFINSFGVSFVTKASLGTSPISSIPYTLSLGFKPSLGQFTLYFSIILILLQMLLLRKNFHKQYYLQIPVSFLFSYFIDFTMDLLSFLKPDTYLLQLLSLLIGCIILGFGVFMEVVADVVMLPGESFVKAVCTTFHKEFGKTKIIFDSSMTLIAALTGIVLYHKLTGVREGTIIAAILVGMIARFLNKKIGFIQKYLLSPDKNSADATTNLEREGIVITISREYGSGGHIIGEKLAEALGFEYYDKNIIKLAAKESNMEESFVEAKEQKLTNSFLYDLVTQYYSYTTEKAPLDKLYEAEKTVIQELAAKGNCIIVGRCAEYILKDFKNCFHIFIHADKEFKIQQIMNREQMNYSDASKKMKTMNKERFIHYKYYTGQIWGMSQNYQLCIDTGKIDFEHAVDLIKNCILS
jgi:Predicted membrane protein